ncbi:hypothetical protein [Leptospira paudalimensis]|uniref:Lipoprotein n=1 Tax=Leptospira paudalimensis TaxID=2950024 RepID=A0ABT3MAK9_9LEPT|nr:hypothetical protein [Leptospira paudalimensis]MCW7505052.1 hypothetical protein [Leptospira paudalimensis]
MKIRSIFILFIFVFLSISCASLLPTERRVYPRNPITFPESMNIHDWIDTKTKQYPNRLKILVISDSEYKITYYRKEHTSLGSYVACSALVKTIEPRKLEIYNMISIVNYADYSKGYMRKSGDLGPMNEKERTDILLPCIEEFLIPPQSKE